MKLLKGFILALGLIFLLCCNEDESVTITITPTTTSSKKVTISTWNPTPVVTLPTN